MNSRVKRFILIVVLSLIVILIAGMYAELISYAIRNNHPQVRMAVIQTRMEVVDNHESNSVQMPAELLPETIKDLSTDDSWYPPPSPD